MSSRNVFRLVVTLSIALAVASAIVAVFPGPLSEDWKTLLLWHGNDGLRDRFLGNLPESTWTRAVWAIILAGLLVYAFAAIVGLFFFRRFARFGFVCIGAFTLALVPFDGLVVMTPLEAAVVQLTLVLDGVIVAMAYLPPIRGEFERGGSSVPSPIPT